MILHDNKGPECTHFYPYKKKMPYTYGREQVPGTTFIEGTNPYYTAQPAYNNGSLVRTRAAETTHFYDHRPNYTADPIDFYIRTPGVIDQINTTANYTPARHQAATRGAGPCTCGACGSDEIPAVCLEPGCTLCHPDS